MNGKSSISARETIVIDESEITQLDELSLTSVVRQLAETNETPKSCCDDGSEDSPSTSFAPQSSDSTINQLLDDLTRTADSLTESKQAYNRDSSSDVELSDEAVDDLLSADILFPKREEG